MDVLLVEDEVLVREMLTEDLADAGLHVTEASSAEVALDQGCSTLCGIRGES